MCSGVSLRDTCKRGPGQRLKAGLLVYGHRWQSSVSLQQRDVQTANILVIFVTLVPMVLDVPVGVGRGRRRLLAVIATKETQENCEINSSW